MGCRWRSRHSTSRVRREAQHAVSCPASGLEAGATQRFALSGAAQSSEPTPAMGQGLFPPIARGQPLLSVIGFSLSLVTTVGLLPLLVRGLGSAGYGAWALTGGIINYIYFFDFGLGFTVMRFVGRNRSDNPT